MQTTSSSGGPCPGRFSLCAMLLFGALAAGAPTEAQGGEVSAVDAPRTLRVGTKVAPPFSMKLEDGSWTGLSILFWKEFTRQEGLHYEFVELPLSGLLEGLEDGSLDAVAAALTMTAPREKVFDFSHPIVTSGLAVALRTQDPAATAVIQKFASGPFARIFGLTLVALSLASIALWFLERSRNPDQFGGSFLQGVGSALWWSVVTMTTVGYGDKAPRSIPGRLLAVVWMITGVILISALTAAITSALTVNQLESPIRGPEDLQSLTVTTVEGSASEEWLQRRGIRTLREGSLADCVAALVSRRAAALVYDEPILRHHLLANPAAPIHVLPLSFQSFGYGIGLPRNSTLREPLNHFILHHRSTARWREVRKRHLGS